MGASNIESVMTPLVVFKHRTASHTLINPPTQWVVQKGRVIFLIRNTNTVESAGSLTGISNYLIFQARVK